MKRAIGIGFLLLIVLAVGGVWIAYRSGDQAPIDIWLR